MDLVKMLLCTAGVLLAAGCAFLGEPEVRIPAFYDLSAGKTEHTASVPVIFRSFSDISGNGLRMVRRLKDGRITFDDLNRFSAPPAQLIRRRLTEDFSVSAANGETLRISGTLLRLEADCFRNEALLEIDYTLEYGGRKTAVRHRILKKIASCSGKDMAAAFEACVDSSALRLAAEAGTFKENCDKTKVKK